MSDEIVEMLVSAQEDLKWYSKHITALKAKYNNKFVAFRHKAVLSADPNLERLLEKLKKKGIDTNVVHIEFISKIPRILSFL